MKKENVIGVVLVLTGIALIFEVTGVIAVNWGESIKTLWPVILVAIGVNLMVSKRKSLVSVVWVFVFIMFIGFGIYKGDELNRLSEYSKRLNTKIYNQSAIESEPFQKEVVLPQGTENGKVILKLDAVELDFSKGSEGLLVTADSNIPKLSQYISKGKQTVIEYSHEKYDSPNTIRRFSLQMNPALIWEIEANIGAADGKLDLSAIPVEQIDISIGAGDLEICIGEQKIDTDISLRAGAAELDIYIPEGAGLKVKSGKLLTDIIFHNIKMENKNGEFISENYKDVNQIINLDILTAISSIQVFTR